MRCAWAVVFVAMTLLMTGCAPDSSSPPRAVTSDALEEGDYCAHPTDPGCRPPLRCLAWPGADPADPAGRLVCVECARDRDCAPDQACIYVTCVCAARPELRECPTEPAPTPDAGFPCCAMMTGGEGEEEPAGEGEGEEGEGEEGEGEEGEGEEGEGEEGEGEEEGAGTGQGE